MKTRVFRALAALGAAAATLGGAQQPAGPPPAFAPSHLTGMGPRNMAMTCAPCHGTNGHAAPGSPFPPLAGRSQGEIMELLGQFKAGTKPATVMHQIAKGLGDDEIAAIAAFFEQQR
jgi:sulfide dehydrogenase cytochrome subunit